MPVTLEQAQQNTTDAVDVAVINEFRKKSWIADNITFDDVVSPAGGGATLTYGYRRKVSQRAAQFRAINAEYKPEETRTEKFSVDLKPLGGSFQIDRVLGKLGPAASGEVAAQTTDVLTATKAKFADATINGDSAVDENSFDGLNVALRGSTTEVGADTTLDWSNITTQAQAFEAIRVVDEWLGLLDDTPTGIMLNNKAKARFKLIAMLAGYYTKTEDAFGKSIDNYNGIPFVDLGSKDGSNADVIPVQSRDVDSAQFTHQVTGGPAGGTYTLLVNGVATEAIAYNAVNAVIQEAINAVPNTQNVVVSGSGTKTIKFNDDNVATLALGTNSLTGGTAPTVAITASGSNTALTGLTDIYAVRMGLDGFHAVSTAGGSVIQVYAPDFTTAGAVKTGEVEMGPVAVVLKATKAAAVLRNVKVQ